tara:strand:- start:70 stop:504 length:435 start_codon:yes stop_codon:yes gene_type:complete
MAKVTRSVIKEIVMECLVEILSEGLVGASESINESKSRPKKRRKSNAVSPEAFQKRNRMLKERTAPKKPDFNAAELTDDPIMQEIFADTAATTFKDQPLTESTKGKPGYVPGDAAAKVVYESDLEDLFDGSQNWAALAFNDGKK